MGERTSPRTSNRWRCAHVKVVQAQRGGRADSRTTPPLPTCCLPASNCGSTRAIMLPRSLQPGQDGGDDEVEADERDINGDQIHQAGARQFGEVAHIGALEHRDTRILAQLPSQLPITDVNRCHVRGPRCNRQSVKLLVEAPTSAQATPAYINVEPIEAWPPSFAPATHEGGAVSAPSRARSRAPGRRPCR